MAWGQPHVAGPGTTQQIEGAHHALDAVHIAPGALAVRAIEAAGAIARLRSPVVPHSAVIDPDCDDGLCGCVNPRGDSNGVHCLNCGSVIEW